MCLPGKVDTKADEKVNVTMDCPVKRPIKEHLGLYMTVSCEPARGDGKGESRILTSQEKQTQYS